MSAAREAELLAYVPHQRVIAGKWVDASVGGTLDVTAPTTGAFIRTIADATPKVAQKETDAAAEKQASWAATPARERRNILRRDFDLLLERADDFALLMTLEMSKPLAESLGEVKYGGEFLRSFSEETVRVRGRYGANPEGTGTMTAKFHDDECQK